MIVQRIEDAQRFLEVTSSVVGFAVIIQRCAEVHFDTRRFGARRCVGIRQSNPIQMLDLQFRIAAGKAKFSVEFDREYPRARHELLAGPATAP